MGLLSRIRNPVDATAQVVGCSALDPQCTKAPCTMQLVVQAPGIAPFSCEQTFEVSAGQWPNPGDVLPVTFDRDHPDRMKVEWDRVPSAADVARQQAAQLAASIGGDAPAAAPGTPGQPVAFTGPAGATPTVINISGAGTGHPNIVVGASSPQAKAAIEKAEQRLGIDLDGDGTVAGAPAAAGQAGGLGALIQQAMAAAQQYGVPVAGMPQPAAAPQPADAVAELEKLAALHDRGVLTDAEFAAQKQKILDES